MWKMKVMLRWSKIFHFAICSPSSFGDKMSRRADWKGHPFFGRTGSPLTPLSHFYLLSCCQFICFPYSAAQLCTSFPVKCTVSKVNSKTRSLAAAFTRQPKEVLGILDFCARFHARHNKICEKNILLTYVCMLLRRYILT